MQKSDRLYLEDILEAIAKIQSYTDRMDFNGFSDSPVIVDAVVRNLEVIGEAVKRLSPETRNSHHAVEWKKIAGLRDILIHEYFGIDKRIIWDVVQSKLPRLKTEIIGLLRELGK